MALELTPTAGPAPAAHSPAPATIVGEPVATPRLRLRVPVRAPVPAPAQARAPAPEKPAEQSERELLDGSAVRSVDRAAALLLALGDFPAEAGVTELARKLGLHKSTASRLLATLQRRGLVEQDEESGKYRLGLVVIRLAERAEKTLDLRTIARPDLARLARATRETVSLGIREGDRCLTVAQEDGPNMVACADWTGRTTPLHCVASGKVFLAAMAERDILRLVRAGLTACTDRTITALEPLLEELARVRRRGFATAFSEWEPGQNAVAAPVHDARGRVVASVSVWGPAYRITPARVADLAADVRAAAGAISIRLGGNPA
jgi:IclR family acetate operon transcriptional repressor